MKIGFLGCGNMGGALCRAARRADADSVLLLADADSKKRDLLSEEVRGESVSNEVLFASADLIFLGLKPQVLPSVLAQYEGEISASHATFVSMAAGLSLETLSAHLGHHALIRMMPNTAVAVGAGMIVYTPAPTCGKEEEAAFLLAMSAAGCCLKIREGLMDAACAVSGCGPAFVYLFLEALADGGVECGLPRDMALTLAAETLEGAARMVKETGIHPATLKDAVCSPGGSTIAGVHALESFGLRAAAMNAVLASYRRTKELSKG